MPSTTRPCLGLLLAVELLEVELLGSKAFENRVFTKSYLLFGKYISKVPWNCNIFDNQNKKSIFDMIK